MKIIVCALWLVGASSLVAAQAAPSQASTPAPGKEAAPSPPALGYDRSMYYGELVKEPSGKAYVVENKSQTHAKDNFVWVRVKNIKKGKARDVGRIRVAIWNSANTYAKEGVRPYRAVSHGAKDAVGDEMLFKIGGLVPQEKLSFFAHFDEKNTGKVAKFLGIPTEQFIFSNSKNQGKGEGLSREGLSAPKFESTLVTYTGPGQEVVLILK